MSTLVNGNVSVEVRKAIAAWTARMGGLEHFGNNISSRFQPTEMSVYKPVETGGTKQARMIFELDVVEDMCTSSQVMQDGCTMTLIDLCTSTVIALLAAHGTPNEHLVLTVSVSLTAEFHAPAPLGCRLKIVNTTVSAEEGAVTARAEIYDINNERLVATGAHTKMAPSTIPDGFMRELVKL
ncbi:hypothetical protein BDW22DRAFT_1430502 [Trametopsis cervina]|nr:hypothetical protein BDW22DRAFT_1430502 [Trametopsis cervina]